MSPCLGVLSAYAWALNNKVSCDFNQPKEQFLISFHLDFLFLGISIVLWAFSGSKAMSRQVWLHSYHAEIAFIWDRAQVSALNYFHFLLIINVLQQEMCQLLMWPGELWEPCSTALCQLSQWLVSTAWWMSHCCSHRCSTPILVSNIPCWMEAKNPAGLRFGSRLLFCFLPFMTAVYLLRYPPFPPWSFMETDIMLLWQTGSQHTAQNHHHSAISVFVEWDLLTQCDASSLAEALLQCHRWCAVTTKADSGVSLSRLVATGACQCHPSPSRPHVCLVCNGNGCSRRSFGQKGKWHPGLCQK